MVERANAVHLMADEARLQPLTLDERQTLRSLLARLIEAEEFRPE